MSDYLEKLIDAAIKYYEFRDGDSLETLAEMAIRFGENNEQQG